MRKLLLILALPMLLISCQPEGRSVKVMAEDDPALRPPFDEDGNFDTINVAKFEFEETVIDFGTIKQGEKIDFTFKFKNVGKAPLMIARANTTCGCTVPSPPEEPIAVGESDVIKGTFNSAGKSGPQIKKITLIANTYPRQTVVSIKGTVETEEEDK